MRFVIARNDNGGHLDGAHDIVFHTQHGFARTPQENRQPMLHDADVLFGVHGHEARQVGGVGLNALLVLLVVAHRFHAALLCCFDKLPVVGLRQAACRKVATGDAHEQQALHVLRMTLVVEHGQTSARRCATNEGRRCAQLV